jgi:hypothetical protein
MHDREAFEDDELEDEIDEEIDEADVSEDQADKALITGVDTSPPKRMRERSNFLSSAHEARQARLHPPTAGSTAKRVGVKTAFKPIGGGEETKRASLTCPHCEGEISAEYLNKALELEDDMEKAVRGPTNYLGNKADPTAGTKVSKRKFRHSNRGKGTGQAVHRHQTPTNPTTEKSFRLPVFVGEPCLVEYTTGADEAIAKSIEQNENHIPPARNLYLEQAAARGE